MSDDPKTREQLLAEIETLKRELEQRDAGAGKPGSAAVHSSAPVFAVPVTRRESLTAWVAPVILALPVVQGLGMVLKPGKAYAATLSPTPALPTDDSPPTDDAPVPVAVPTVAATAAPTRAGRCIVAPTAAPVASPTLGAGAAPDSRPCPTGFVALGGARAVARQLAS